MLVIFKLIETCACRSEQHYVTRSCSLRRDFDRAVERAGTLDGYAAVNLACDLICGGANQQGPNRFFAQRRLQRRVVATFVLAAEDHQNSTGKRFQHFTRRVDVGRFGIVVVTHAVDFAHELKAMLDSLKGAHTFGDGFSAGPSDSRCGNCRQDILEVMSSGKRDLVAPEHNFFCAIVTKNNVVATQKRTLRSSLLAAEPIHVWTCRGERSCSGIVGIQNREIFLTLVLKDACLGFAVKLQRMVPV